VEKKNEPTAKKKRGGLDASRNRTPVKKKVNLDQKRRKKDQQKERTGFQMNRSKKGMTLRGNQKRNQKKHRKRTTVEKMAFGRG